MTLISDHFIITCLQFSSVTQSCPTLCNPMNFSTAGLPVHHQLPEFTQTHVHWVGDAIQPSHPLFCLPSILPSIKVFSMSQLFASGGQISGASSSTSVLPVNIQGWFPLGLTGFISLLSRGLSKIFSSLKASFLWCSAFFMVQLSYLIIIVYCKYYLIIRVYAC